MTADLSCAGLLPDESSRIGLVRMVPGICLTLESTEMLDTFSEDESQSPANIPNRRKSLEGEKGIK